MSRAPTRRRRPLLRRALALAALVAVPALAPLGAPPAEAVPGQEGTGGGGDNQPSRPSRPIRWAALGDSYSAGEGLSDSEAPCHRSPGAYAPRARDMLADGGWDIEAFDHVACTGAQTHPPSGDAGETVHLDQQIAELDGRYDLVTLSIGGNNAHFGDIVRACIEPRNAIDLGCYRLVHEWNVYHELRNRDDSVTVTLDRKAMIILGRMSATRSDRIRRALRAAFDRYVPTIECHESHADGTLDEDNATRCNRPEDAAAFDLSYDDYRSRLVDQMGRQLPGRMDLDSLGARLTESYSAIIRDHLTPGGHVVVIGYPRLFEPPDRWARLARRLGNCHAFAPEFVPMFRGAGDALGDVITDATAQFPQISFVPVADTFEGHNLCATGGHDAEWLHGITPGLRWSWPPARIEESFHPNQRGYDAEAALLADRLRRLDWDLPDGYLVAGFDGVEVRRAGHDPLPVTFGQPGSGEGAASLLRSALGRPDDEVPPWAATVDPPECWNDAYGISMWGGGERVAFAALYARSAVDVGGRQVAAGSLLGYRAYQDTSLVTYSDGVGIGATIDDLRAAYTASNDRLYNDAQFGGPAPGGVAYQLVPVEAPDILYAQELPPLGPELGTATGQTGSDTIVARAAGLDGLQCGLDLVPEVYDPDDEGDDDEPEPEPEPEPGACAARIGIVMDASPSIVDAGAEGQVRDAATQVVDALAESGAEVRVSAFAGFPVSLTSGWVSLADDEGVRLARQVVGSMAFEGSGTNWEAALMDLNGQDADVVVLVTDGNPNEYGVGIPSSPGPDSTTDFDPLALDAGVAAADTLRDQGADVVAVGAGDVRADSLSQVAGPVEGEDYYVGDFGDLGPSLAEVAATRCEAA